jgi:sulfate adenylyltransferase (ADP) / ATP adenylyltransferase
VTRLPNEWDATHNLVLNKYPVIPRHSIISTIGFKRQTDLLESLDLDVTYSCLQAWEESAEPSRAFAFFNSGAHSGASQRHRHLQCLSVNDMMEPALPGTEWQPLIDSMTEPLPDHPTILINPKLPFFHFAMSIPVSPDAGTLQQIYHRLYDRASRSLQSWKQGAPPEDTAGTNHTTETLISYNLAMTTRAMAICPRRNETAMLSTTSGEGSVPVNGTILGGTLMVKELSEWDALRNGHVRIDEVLKEIGIPSLGSLGEAPCTRL